MQINSIFFDLDGTIYPEQNGLWRAIKDRIDIYLLERMGFAPEDAQRIRQKFLQEYGTTLRGLQEEYHIDTNDYLIFVHDIQLETYLKPDPALKTLIRGIKPPKWIFTNSDYRHARKVLRILDIEDEFDGIIDIHALSFECKPNKEAYYRAMSIAGISNPHQCLLIDDSLDNIHTAVEIGFNTVLISELQLESEADFTLASIHQIRDVLPELWQLTHLKSEK